MEAEEGSVVQVAAERDLLALFRRAADMMATNDVPALLRIVVRWTRELLGSDVAYVTMFDEATGDFYVRESEGFLSEAFLGLRSPVRGFGVYGFIIDHGRPFWSPDYAHDERFPHLPETNHAIATEGIHGLLGAPAPLPSRDVPAVIFAGWRREGREITEDEIALLVAWGLLVGATIDNALHATARAEELADLTARTTDLSQSVSVLRRLSDVRERLSDVAAQGGAIEEIVDLVRAEIDHDVVMLDDPMKVEDLTCQAGEPSGAVAMRQAIDASRRGGRSVAVPQVAATVTAITSRATLLATLVVGSAELSRADQQILEHAALVIGAQLVAQERIAGAEKRAMSDVVTGLLKSPQDDLTTLRHQAARYGVELRAPELGMLLADLGGQPAGKALDRARRCLVDTPALIGLYDGRLVVIAPGVDRALAQRLQQDLAPPDQPATVVMMPGPLLDIALPDTHQRAVRALALLVALGRRGAVASDEELAPFAVAFGGMDAAAVEAFIDRAIGPLIRQDDERGTELVQTLVTYLDHGLNVRATSEALFVHGNTVRQRLTAIAKLLPALDDATRRLDMHLAARLHRLRMDLRP